MEQGFFHQRFRSGLLAGLFGLLVVGLGGWWFTIALCVIVHLALLEFFRMAQFTGIRPATKTTLVACQLLLIFTQWGVVGGLPADLSSAILPISGAAICGWLLLQPVTGSIADIAASIFGLFYLGFLPSHWIKLRNLNDFDLFPVIQLKSLFDTNFITLGMVITFLACFMIVASDIGSYVVGSNFGKHQLSPISPSKTVEGALGGIFFSIIIGVIAGELFFLRFGYLIGIILGSLVAIFALVGDLIESMMKRSAGIKDSGDALPGHGGILDRIDSYLFTSAVVYYAIILMTSVVKN